MAPPDGFTKPKPKALLKTPTPRFASAFDPHDSPTPESKSASTTHRSSRSSTLIIPDETVAPSGNVRLTMRTLKPPTLIYATPPRPRPIPTPRRTTPLTSYKPIPVLETSPDKPTAILQRPPPPPSITTSSSASKTAGPLISLPPPPALVPGRPSSPLKEMHTISTTRVARATDLKTDNGNAELASIFLHDQHPDINFPNGEANANVEEHRGILISPEKGTKGKGPRFIRNGLASVASSALTRSHTSLSLWQKETEYHLSPSSSHRLTPDLRLLIIKILHIPHPPSANSKHPSPSQSLPGVALCRLLSSNPNTRLNEQKEIYTVLLSFTTPFHPQTRIRNPEDFAEGKEVYVWQPWQRISLSMSELRSSAHNMECDIVEFPGIAESVSSTALLCLRFLIVR